MTCIGRLKRYRRIAALHVRHFGRLKRVGRFGRIAAPEVLCIEADKAVLIALNVIIAYNIYASEIYVAGYIKVSNTAFYDISKHLLNTSDYHFSSVVIAIVIR